jgi:hypothetical protein
MKGNIYAGLDGKEWGAVERTRRDSSEEKKWALTLSQIYLSAYKKLPLAELSNGL